MRIWIENLLTIFLWKAWIGSSFICITDFLTKKQNATLVTKLFYYLELAPVIALICFAIMQLTIKASKRSLKVKSTPALPKVVWDQNTLDLVQSSKIIDLYFESTGLQCDPVIRSN